LNGSPGKPNPNKCLFYEDEYKIVSEPEKSLMGPLLSENSEIAIYLDVENNSLRIYEP
jgi:hypothetical protein